MNVTRASHRTATNAIQRLSPAMLAVIQLGNRLLRSCSVYTPATNGAAAQKSTFAAS